jgi:hypothetical protein
MSVGSGIAIAGWFIAFAWATSVSQDATAGVILGGLLVVGAYHATRR